MKGGMGEMNEAGGRWRGGENSKTFISISFSIAISMFILHLDWNNVRKTQRVEKPLHTPKGSLDQKEAQV